MFVLEIDELSEDFLKENFADFAEGNKGVGWKVEEISDDFNQNIEGIAGSTIEILNKIKD